MDLISVDGRPDFRSILHLLRAIWPPEWGKKTDTEMLQFFDESYDGHTDTIRILKRGGTEIGFSRYSLYPRDDPDPKSAHVYDIVVLPEYRGQGLARLMMTDMIDSCRRRGLNTLLSRTLKSNAASIGLHRAAGFQVDFETGDSIVWKLSLTPGGEQTV